ncbi:MAG: YkgJ family cysteine cluster protein, partial [Myxococcaceae bacterium]
MRAREDTADDDHRGPARARERAALLETRALYRLADAAYAPFSCPASGECCQLAARGREPWLWPSEWRLLQARG